MPHRRSTRYALLRNALFALLPLMLIGAYSNTFNSPFLLDDYHSFVQNPNVRIDSLSYANLAALAKTVFGWPRWVPMVTLAANKTWGEDSVFGYHVFNLAIHCLCFLSVAFLIVQLRKRRDELTDGQGSLPPFDFAVLVAALWALHPVQTNAVTYIVQRMASLQTLFYVLSVSCYVLARRQHLAGGRWQSAGWAYLCCAVAALVSFFCKENSAMLPVMLLTTEIWFFTPDLVQQGINRVRQGPRKLQVGVAVIALISFLTLIKTIWGLNAGYAGRHFTMWERLLTESRIVIWYVSLLFFPAPSRFAIEHDFPLSHSLFSPPTTVVAIAVIATSLWAICRWRHRAVLVTYGILWFFLNLAIESSFVPLELVFEHRLYLSSIGMALVLLTVATSLLSRILVRTDGEELRLITVSACAVLLSALTLLTFIRNEAWENGVSIYWDSASKNPNHPRAQANLAVAYARHGLSLEAIAQAEKALPLGRHGLEAHATAAQVIVGGYVDTGQFERALQRGKELLASSPERMDHRGVPTIHLQMGRALARLGRFPEAYTEVLTALNYLRRLQRPGADFQYEKRRLIEGVLKPLVGEAQAAGADLDGDGVADPGDRSVNLWIARELLKQGERMLAMEKLAEVLAAQPGDREASEQLRAMRQEDAANAAQFAKGNFSRLYVDHPFSPFNALMAGAYLVQKHQGPQFLKTAGEMALDQALQMRPKSPDAHLLKAWYQFDQGRLPEAIAAGRRALELDPQYARAWLAMTLFHASTGEPIKATQAYQQAVRLFPASSAVDIGQIHTNPIVRP